MRRYTSRLLPVLFLGLVASCGEVKVLERGPDYGPEGSSADVSAKDDSATSPASMARLSTGVALRTTFTATGRWRAFKFAGTAGAKVDLFVDGLRGLDTVAYVYNVSVTTGRPFGRAITSNDDAADARWTSNPQSSSILGFTPRYSRDYAVVVTTYRQAGRGSATVLVRPGAGAPAGNWDTRAKEAFLALLARPGTDYRSDASRTIAEASLPLGARGQASDLLGMGNGVVWRFVVDGKTAYAAMSEGDDRFFADLFDSQGRWVAHGYAFAGGGAPGQPVGHFPSSPFTGAQSFAWDDNNANDPTLCRCSNYEFVCTHVDGTTFPGESDCS